MFCVICLIAPEGNDDIVSTLCGHCFHQKCIENSLKVDDRCPTCRQTICVTDFRKIFLNLDFSTAKSSSEKEIIELKEKVKNGLREIERLLENARPGDNKKYEDKKKSEEKGKAEEKKRAEEKKKSEEKKEMSSSSSSKYANGPTRCKKHTCSNFHCWCYILYPPLDCRGSCP